ncbi:MAG: FecR domain-containing protein [Prolixibacteraceae bacterium]
MINTEQIHELIIKEISGNAGAEESLKLKNWLAESDDNLKVYQASLKTWSVAETWLEPDLIQHDKLKIVRDVNQRLVAQSYRTKRRSRIYLAAAVLAFPIAMALSFLFNDSSSSESVDQTIVMSAPAGHISKCMLPDGTAVWINSGSQLLYKSSGFDGRIREVSLDGEAYFEVVKNKSRPFYVRTGIADVKVTGTSFNLKADHKSKAFETVLTEGSIELQLEGRNPDQSIKLKPGEKAVFDAGQKKMLVQEVNPEVYSAWRNGEIIFQDATLSDLIIELERIYDVKFRLSDPDLGNYRFRGIFSYDNNLIGALEKFKVTAHIDYYIKDKEVWLSKK